MADLPNPSGPNPANFFENMAGGVADAYNSFVGVKPEGTAPGNDLKQSEYNFQYTVFPNDIGMDYQGHYVVININVPTKGFKAPGRGLDVYPVAGAFKNFISPLTQVSKLDTLRYGNYDIPGAPDAARRQFFSIPRNTRRIAESIALYMPTPLTFNQQNVYEEISLSALAGKGIGVFSQYASGLLGLSQRTIGAAFGAGVGYGATGNFAGAAVGAGVGAVAVGNYGAVSTAFKIAQSPINPAIEVIFANTLQRQFIMEWLLCPRNEAESIAVQRIVRRMRFHGSPEINPDYAGLMWIPPADFDITFFNKGVENTNILRINTCVLERCEVQYDPTGIYSTFRNGHPVAVRLSLAFRELEPMHKLRVYQGF